MELKQPSRASTAEAERDSAPARRTYHPSSATLAPMTESSALPRIQRSQWLFGGGVIGFALVLQMLPMLLHRPGRGWPGAIYWLVQTPILLLVLLFAYWLTKRLRLSVLRALILTMGAAIFAGAVAGILTHLILLHAWGPGALPGPPGAPPSPWRGVLFGSVAGLFTAGFWALGFVYPSALEAQRSVELEKERLVLERRALENQSALQQLRARLEPHFLLNTLNAISGLVTQDPTEARRLLATLGELLSDTREDELQSLKSEIEWLRGYASLLEARFAGRLAFSWDIDPSALDVLVPHLLIQPLVENAVTHGALHAAQDGNVAIAIRRTSDETGRPGLLFTISNTGPRFDPESVREGAFGIAAVERRLALWDDEATLRFDGLLGLTRAVVWFPLGEEP